MSPSPEYTKNRRYADDNRMTAGGTITYTWDDNGNMLSKTSGITTTNCSYDYENRLSQIADGTNTYSYTYNGDGLRTSSNVNGSVTSWTWDINGGLPKLIGDGASSYLYGVGLILKGDGTVRYYYTDALGSTRSLANGNGVILQSYDYKAFGDILSSSGSTNTYLRYTGQQNDPESGLYYLTARYYDPTTGRFLTVDPLPAVNPYIYVENCPTGLVDPSGQGSYRMPHYMGGDKINGFQVGFTYCGGTQYVHAEVGVAFTDTDSGVFVTGASGTQAGGAGFSVTGGPLATNAHKLSDLNGPFADNGGSGGYNVALSYNHASSIDNSGTYVDEFGVGPGMGGEYHNGVSQTATMRFSDMGFTASGTRPMPRYR